MVHLLSPGDRYFLFLPLILLLCSVSSLYGSVFYRRLVDTLTEMLTEMCIWSQNAAPNSITIESMSSLVDGISQKAYLVFSSSVLVSTVWHFKSFRFQHDMTFTRVWGHVFGHRSITVILVQTSVGRLFILRVWSFYQV